MKNLYRNCKKAKVKSHRMAIEEGCDTKLLIYKQWPS